MPPPSKGGSHERRVTSPQKRSRRGFRERSERNGSEPSPATRPPEGLLQPSTWQRVRLLGRAMSESPLHSPPLTTPTRPSLTSLHPYLNLLGSLTTNLSCWWRHGFVLLDSIEIAEYLRLRKEVVRPTRQVRPPELRPRGNPGSCPGRQGCRRDETPPGNARAVRARPPRE